MCQPLHQRKHHPLRLTPTSLLQTQRGDKNKIKCLIIDQKNHTALVFESQILKKNLQCANQDMLHTEVSTLYSRKIFVSTPSPGQIAAFYFYMVTKTSKQS